MTVLIVRLSTLLWQFPNYSRKVLAWRIATRLSARLSLAALREAHAQSSGSRINLIVDGGSENHAQVIEEFIARDCIHIQKKIALRDVHFSNSLVESVNKLLKYRYLFPRQAANGAALTTHLAEAIQDCNDVRTHGSLNGLKPSEAYQGREIPERPYFTMLKQAKTDRLIKNKKNTCGICPK